MLDDGFSSLTGEVLKAKALQISQAVGNLPDGVHSLVLNIVMAHTGFPRCPQCGRYVDQPGAKRNAGFFPYIPRGSAKSGPLSDIFDVHQRKSAGILVQQLYRILISEDNPENVHFKIDELRIRVLCKRVE